MRKLSTLLTVAALILISSTGCIKNTKPAGYTPPTDEFFSYTANGVDYYYQQYDLLASWSGRRAIELGSSISQGGYYDFRARKPEDPSGSFRFKFAPKSYFENNDTFPIENIGVDIANFLASDSFNHYGGGKNGKLIITERTSTYIRGIFNFTTVSHCCGDSLVITNGKFKVNFKK